MLVSYLLHYRVLLFLRELGRQRSNIELDTPSMKPDQVQALEEAANDKIREHLPVNVQLLSLDDPEVEKVLTVSEFYECFFLWINDS